MLSTTADHADFTMPARARGQSASVSATRLKRHGQRAAAPASGLKAYVLNHPGRASVWAGLLVCTIGIAVNAMWLQTGQRLSPAAQLAAATLASQPPLPPVRPPQQELVRQIQITPAQNAVAAAPASPQPASPVTPAARQAQTPAPVVTQASTRAERRDEIGDLLKAQEPGATAARTADGRSPAATGDNRQIANAQRALAKLGYTTARVDGRLGEDTRSAIERFERERKLPVTRDISPRTMRELAAVAGTRFE